MTDYNHIQAAMNLLREFKDTTVWLTSIELKQLSAIEKELLAQLMENPLR